MAYPFIEIENYWQDYWEKKRTFLTPADRSKPKYYILDMFPYPSGEGLHVGHPEGYTATDIVARAKRMQGFNVLHPMGWDAFGLPAERYAMQTGIHPSVITKKNVDNFRRQLKSLGFSYDWEREISTTDPEYYRWTQWIFLKIYNSFYDEKSGRARPISELEIPESLRSEDRSEERENFIRQKRLAYIADVAVNWCAKLGTVLANEEVDEWVEKGYTVERRPMRQWMLRITAYADRLLEDLKFVEWPVGTLELQKNWIGRSEGAEVFFPLVSPEAGVKQGADAKSQKSLTIFTTRPDTLYGVTYMVLAPEHPLIFEIASEENREAIESYKKEASFKSELDRQIQGEKAEKSGVFTGGYVLHPLTGKKIPVWISDYVLMSYGTGAIMSVPAHDERDYAFAKAFNLPVEYVIKPADAKGDDWKNGGAYTGPGVNFNSDILNGLETKEAMEKMNAHLEATGKGKRRINFKLRDWLFSRQRYWGEPIPVSFDETGGMKSESPENLPLVLPKSDEFQPADTGESPLANLTDWVNYAENGKKYRRETNTMPQWAGSCWYYLRFLSPKFSEALTDPEEERYWMGENGVDLYVGGAEHAVLHLLYARFWHKILYDLGYVSGPEPFRKLIHQGLILGEDNRKMSKSLGNVVNPDQVVKEFGADALRLYEMFLGPLEQKKPWSTKGIEGVFRFLSRVWRLYTEAAGSDESAMTGKADAKIDSALLEAPPEELKKDTERVLHQTIRKVTEDIEKLSFNTAISQMMIFVNEFFSRKKIGKEAADQFLLILSPFAPHLAEELWRLLGHENSLAHESWPIFDPSKAAADEIEVVFQVNGKVRGKAALPAGSSEEDLKKAAMKDDAVLKFLEGKEPKRVIVVKGKLVNIVI